MKPIAGNFFGYTKPDTRTQSEILNSKQLLKLPANYNLRRVERMINGTANTENIRGAK